MTRHFIPLLAALALTAAPAANAQEDAATAVKNMRIGWNAGNRLDANSGDASNMWIEAWTDRLPANYETAWGQPQITPQLIHMLKEAGFNAVRVPVTWYPHMGNVKVDVGPNSAGDWVGVWDRSVWTDYTVDPAWMARVREVVDYVISEGMYCIVNVHHDTGDATTAWLRADETVYQAQRERFENLWTQIAEEFRDYDDHLLFEGYNEMLDSYGSWCFASFNTSSKYNATVAKSAYNAINGYAQSFVDAVRATGGNNATRNLIVCTYGACSGEGTWNSHLTDPLTQFTLPTDINPGHLITEIHSYPSPTTVSEAAKAATSLMTTLKTHLLSKGAPVIIGEWGLFTSDTNPNRQAIFCEYARQLVSKAKDEGIATFLWMVATEGSDCSVPKWTNTELKDAIVEGYYGEGGYQGITDITADAEADAPLYNLQGIRVDTPTAPGVYISRGHKILLKP